jgi:type II secretion system protein N
MPNVLSEALSRLDRFRFRRGPSRSAALWTLYFLAMFAVCFVATFPHDLVARRLVEDLELRGRWKIRFADVGFVPWEGYRFANLTASGPADGPPWFDAPRASLRPALGPLLRGRLGSAVFRGEAYGGTFSGSWAVDSGSRLVLSWDRLDVGQYPRLRDLVDGQWAGRLSGELELAMGAGLRELEGRGTLRLRDGSLRDGNLRGFALPNLTGIAGDAEIEIKAGRGEIRSLKLSGAEVDAELRGQIYLREPLVESILNATLTVKPLPGAPAGLDGLLQATNRGQRPPSGTYTFALYGMLDRLRVR